MREVRIEKKQWNPGCGCYDEGYCYQGMVNYNMNRISKIIASGIRVYITVQIRNGSEAALCSIMGSQTKRLRLPKPS